MTAATTTGIPLTTRDYIPEPSDGSTLVTAAPPNPVTRCGSPLQGRKSARRRGRFAASAATAPVIAWFRKKNYKMGNDQLAQSRELGAYSACALRQTQPLVPEMTDTTTLGLYLRRERERRGLTLRVISENTKVSLTLLEGLEADNISRWPGGIFRRAFVRSYAQCVGLDPDDVFRRFEEQFRPPEFEVARPSGSPLVQIVQAAAVEQASRPAALGNPPPGRSRVLGTAADLTVAVVLAFGSAAAGSRLLWPVLLIAVYYAVGILLTGTSPMVALLSDQSSPAPRPDRALRGSQPAADSPLPHRRGMQPGVS